MAVAQAVHKLALEVALSWPDQLLMRFDLETD
jgi:hypothetical protein